VVLLFLQVHRGPREGIVHPDRQTKFGISLLKSKPWPLLEVYRRRAAIRSDQVGLTYLSDPACRNESMELPQFRRVVRDTLVTRSVCHAYILA
jgi:hypothetical protein